MRSTSERLRDIQGAIEKDLPNLKVSIAAILDEEES